MFVMPAWITGIQIRRMLPGDIHVSLDSSDPCWNDAIEGIVLKQTERFSTSRIFEGALRNPRRVYANLIDARPRRDVESLAVGVA